MTGIRNHSELGMRDRRRQHFTVLPRDHPVLTSPDDKGISRDSVHFLRQFRVGVLTANQSGHDLAALPLSLELLSLTHVLHHSAKIATDHDHTGLCKGRAQK